MSKSKLLIEVERLVELDRRFLTLEQAQAARLAAAEDTYGEFDRKLEHGG